MKLTLMKVGALYCGPCIALDKRGTLQKFQAEHPDVNVEIHDDNEEGSSKRWEAFADKWKVRSMPTIIWVAGGKELFRFKGAPTLADLEKQYRRALKDVG